MYQEQQTFIPFTELYNDLPFIKTESSLSLQHPHQLLLTESFHPNHITTFTSNSVKQQQDVFFLDDFEYLYKPTDNLDSNYTGIMEYNSGDSFTSSPSSSMCSVLENDFCFFPDSPSPSLSTPPPLPIQIEQQQKQTQSQPQMYIFSVKEKEEKAKSSLSPCQHNTHNNKKSNQHQHQSTMIPSISQKKNRTFACHLCLRQFARKHDLQRHIRVHTGVKPYSCLNCSKSFVRTDALKRHLRLDENCKKSPIIQAMAKSGNRRYQNL